EPEAPASAAPPAERPAPFQRLREAEADRLAEILLHERPQMIALVLSHLPHEQAGRVLVRLAPRLQVEVIRRLVDLEETDPEVLAEIERAFEARLASQVRRQRPRTAGLSAAAGIVRAACASGAAGILDHLASHDPHLAQQLAPDPIAFDQLALLEDASLAAVFQAAEPEVALLALIGAPERLIDRIARQLPAPEAAQLRHRLAHIGPIRLSDVAEARRRIEQIAWQLASAGRIHVPRLSSLAA
ncbi:MAG TPA: hypothetical protein EYP56_15890, partial [Planctomycetaceae bacterium]|nr:hypothetical protein [Planctomycetaceae bacterium]